MTTQEFVEEAPPQKKAKPKIDLRAQILSAPDIEEELVPVPGWGEGVEVLVRGLSGTERAKFQKQITAQTPGAQQGALAINWERFWVDLIILTARDPEDGSLLFKLTDRAALAEKSAKNLELVAKKARELSGLDDDALSKSEDEDTED